MKLQELPGVGVVTEKKLNDHGVRSVEDLMSISPSDIGDLTGMDSASVRTLIAKARTRLQEENKIPETFRSASKLEETKRDNVEFITTGTDIFDTLLDGGIETQAITEVFGQFGSGKTQFCHTMAARVQLPKEEGGLDGKCLWIDTEKTFHPSRMKQITDREDVLDNIIVAHAHNSVEQQIILEEARDLVVKENIKLIVIDSAIGLFRNEYIGRGNLSDRQGKITRFINLVSKIAQNNNIAVLITNQVMVDPGLMFGDPTKPVGGSALAHTSTYRIYFQKRGKKHYAVMVDSPRHPDMELRFDLTEKGVVDVEEEKKPKKEKIADK